MNCTKDKETKLPAEMTEAEFVEVFGGVYEHSPWISRDAFHQGINEEQNTSVGLSSLMMDIVASADKTKVLGLINAHPDLAGKAAVDGTLTAESTSEQSGAGIDQCTAEEFEDFQKYNNAYKEKFRFPFIMAVKGSNRHLILEAFEKRLKNDEETEFNTAVSEVHKIAKFRLDDLLDS